MKISCTQPHTANATIATTTTTLLRTYYNYFSLQCVQRLTVQRVQIPHSCQYLKRGLKFILITTDGC